MSATVETPTVVFPWPDPVVPNYRAGKQRAWSCSKTPGTYNKTAGYFRIRQGHPPGWVIKRGQTVWMSLTPMELESHMPHIAAASGDVVVCGLGMGMVIYNLSRKPEVRSITVVEKDADVIALMDRISDWRSWPKVTLVHGDALDYVPDHPVDFLYVDIWHNLGADEAPEQTRAIQAHVQAKAVGYWGQEIDFFDYGRKREMSLGAMTTRVFKEFAADLCLPLIGGQWPRYGRFAVAAAVLQVAAGKAVSREQRPQLLGIYHRLMGTQ